MKRFWFILFAFHLCFGISAVQADDALHEQADWIWHTRDTEVQKGVDHFFSKTITLHKKAGRAWIHITAEGSCALSVNGRNVGENDKWFELAAYDIGPYLKEGKNEILARVIPDNWYAGFFTAGAIETEDGETISILSDAAWDTWTAKDPLRKKADRLVKGIDGGFWNNVTPVEMPALHNTLNIDLTAPHIPWARPYGGKTPRVLAIFPRQVQRDFVELMHRFDMDATVVFSDYYREDRRAPFFRAVQGALKKDVTGNISRALKDDYDLIILGDIPPDVFEETLADRLLSKMRSGTGLIFTKTFDAKTDTGAQHNLKSLKTRLTGSPIETPPEYLTAGIPLKHMPGLFDKVSLYRYEDARVAEIRKAGRDMLLTPDDGKDDLVYEYHQSFLIKLILWSARKEPDTRIQIRSRKIDGNYDDESKIVFDLKSAKPPVAGLYSAALKLRAMDPYHRVPEISFADAGLHIAERHLRPIFSAETPVETSRTAAFTIPFLPKGEYLADVILLKDEKPIDWISVSVNISSPIFITSVEKDPAFLDFSKKERTELTVRARFSQKLPAGSRVRFSVIDNYDRLVNDTEVSVEAGNSHAEHRFLVSELPTTLVRARAELKSGDKSLDIETSLFTSIRRERDRFAFAGWAHAGTDSRQKRLLARILAGLGFDAQRGREGGVDRLEVADIRAFPGAGGRRIAAVDTDSETLERTTQETKTLAEKNLPFDPFGYVTPDEISYGGGELLPARLDAFRRSLEHTYGSIEALNVQWGTDFSSFAKVPPVTPSAAETLITRAEATLNFSPIVDQYLENCRVYADHFGVYQEALSAGDPGARFGIESPLWPWANRYLDWYAILQKIRLFSPYGREGDLQTYEYARSFARPGTLLGMTYGGYIYNGFVRLPQPMDLEFQFWRPWNALMRGFDCVYWYTLGAVVESGVGMGLEPYPAFLTAVEQIERIRKGYYTLLRGTQRIMDPVAVHYSVASNILSEHIQDFGKLPWNVHMLLRILQDYVPVGYTFLATPQIEAGELNDYEAFIMPLSQAVTEKEAVAIRRFAENGGLVIADVRPGICDGHGKFGANRIMQELFGISFGKSLGRQSVALPETGLPPGWIPERRPAGVPVDPALKLSEEKAAVMVDGVPLVVSNKIGNGTAVCLNIPFNNFKRYPTPDALYYYLADTDHAALVGTILKSLLDEHGFERSLEVAPDGDTWPMGLETWYFNDGRARYAALTKRRMKKTEPDRHVRIRSPYLGHVYDMFTGGYLGEKSSWDVIVGPADVHLFSVLPYAVRGIRGDLQKKRIRRGEEIAGKVQVEIASGKPARHVVHLDVFRPDGKPVSYLSQNLETQNGSAGFSVPTALNDPAGKYTMVFTDVATQMKSVVKVDVN